MIKIGSNDTSGLKIGSQFNLSEKYKNKIIENEKARHTHDNKEVLDSITTKMLKKMDCTIVNFDMVDPVGDPDYSAYGSANMSCKEVFNILNTGGTVIGKFRDQEYTVTSYSSDSICFSAINSKYLSSVIMCSDLLNGYFVGERRYKLSNVSTNDPNIFHEVGQFIMVPVTYDIFDQYFEVCQVTTEFVSDGTLEVLYNNSVRLGIHKAEYANRSRSDEYGRVIHETYAQLPCINTPEEHETDITVTLTDNLILNFVQQPLSSLTINCIDNYFYYGESITFTSTPGETSTSFKTASPVKMLFKGDDCGTGVLVPTANKIYNLIFTTVGKDVWVDVASREVLTDA